MTDAGFPANAAALTAEWLTEALRSTRTIAAARVTSYRPTLIAEGKGFSGQIARVGLSYDVAEPGAPTSLIAKFQFAPADPDIKEFVFQSRMFEREYRFYRDVASEIALRIPRLYRGVLSYETGACLLLLEDLAPAETLNMLDGCPIEDAALVVRHLAAFHAAWWERPRLTAMDWLPAYDAQAERDEQNYAKAWPTFVEKMGGLLPERLASLGERLRRHVANVKRSLGRSPRTFLHGDFHLHNLMFHSGPAGRTLIVIDWQACSRGQGTRDLLHFLVTGLLPSDRRTHEFDLLRLYHATLVENGVRNYSFEQCLTGYRMTMLDELVFLVMVLAHLDFSASEAAAKIRDMAIERIGAAVLDHRPDELLTSIDG